MALPNRGVVGRITEVLCDLLGINQGVKDTTDQMEFVDGKLRTTGEDAGGGGGSQDVVDAIDDLAAIVSTEVTLDLVLDETEAINLNTQSIAFEAELNGKLLQVDAVGTTTYIGYANPGTATSSATWAVKRIIETGSDVSITWADGNRTFDNIWDNRLALIYS